MSDPLDSLLDFVDNVSKSSPLKFLEDAIHGKEFREEDEHLIQGPIEIKMEDGYKIGCHMLNKISNIKMFETQDDNLRGSIMNALSYEAEKVFEVIDSDTGYPAMVVKESSGFCARNCMPAKCRPFRFTMFSRASPTLLLPAAQIDKGFSVTCVNKMMKVTSHDKRHTLGYIEPKTHCCYIHFNAYDKNKKEIFKIEGNKFQLSSIVGKLPLPGLKRIVFNAVDDRGHNLGYIANEWGGFFRELLGDADDYTVKFKTERMSPEDKLMLLATAFYLDMRYFTSCCSFSVRDCLIKRYIPKPVVRGIQYAPVALYGAKKAPINKSKAS